MQVHMSVSPVFRLAIAGRNITFEEHRWLGPVVLDRHGEPAKQQPSADDIFFEHYKAWCDQGKKTERAGDVTWCKYTTRQQRLRKRRAQVQKGTP